MIGNEEPLDLTPRQAAEARYTKFPVYHCTPVSPTKSCGRTVPGFPGMDAQPCPECTQRTREGQPMVKGVLRKLLFEEAEPEWEEDPEAVAVE